MSKASDPAGLVKVYTSSGAYQLVSRASLSVCAYFETVLGGRWDGNQVQCDIDHESFAVIARLLRYGPEAVPSLAQTLRLMVLKDADYLGVPAALWGHLAAPGPAPTLHERAHDWEQNAPSARLDTCPRCQRRGCRALWRCVTCERTVGPNEAWAAPQNGEISANFRIHDCQKCGIEYAQKLADHCFNCGRNG